MAQFIEDKEATLRPDSGDFHKANSLIEWTIKRYYSEHIEELQGDAEAFLITEVHVYADEPPEIVYTLKEA